MSNENFLRRGHEQTHFDGHHTCTRFQVNIYIDNLTSNIYIRVKKKILKKALQFFALVHGLLVIVLFFLFIIVIFIFILTCFGQQPHHVGWQCFLSSHKPPFSLAWWSQKHLAHSLSSCTVYSAFRAIKLLKFITLDVYWGGLIKARGWCKMNWGRREDRGWTQMK